MFFLIGDQTWHRKQIQMFEMESKTNYGNKKNSNNNEKNV